MSQNSSVKNILQPVLRTLTSDIQYPAMTVYLVVPSTSGCAQFSLRDKPILPIILGLVRVLSARVGFSPARIVRFGAAIFSLVPAMLHMSSFPRHANPGKVSLVPLSISSKRRHGADKPVLTVRRPIAELSEVLTSKEISTAVLDHLMGAAPCGASRADVIAQSNPVRAASGQLAVAGLTATSTSMRAPTSRFTTAPNCALNKSRQLVPRSPLHSTKTVSDIKRVSSATALLTLHVTFSETAPLRVRRNVDCRPWRSGYRKSTGASELKPSGALPSVTAPAPARPM